MKNESSPMKSNPKKKNQARKRPSRIDRRSLLAAKVQEAACEQELAHRKRDRYEMGYWLGKRHGLEEGYRIALEGGGQVKNENSP